MVSPVDANSLFKTALIVSAYVIVSVYVELFVEVLVSVLLVLAFVVFEFVLPFGTIIVLQS